ncbi:MAG TPA: hypothetical protein VGE93_12835 [Bryobacteraceae bacterium]
MKGALRAANVLSWFNLFYWGIPLAMGLLSSLSAFNPLVLVVFVLLCCIPLHAYAALQLHKSIRRPEIKLSHQTPAGIRFVGLIAMLFGVLMILFGVGLLRYAPDVLKMLQEQKADFESTGMGTMTVAKLRQIGIGCLVPGSITVVNVILNLRLLRWYYLVHQSDAS